METAVKTKRCEFISLLRWGPVYPGLVSSTNPDPNQAPGQKTYLNPKLWAQTLPRDPSTSLPY